MLRLPHGVPRVAPSATDAVWGMWPQAYCDLVKPWSTILKQYLAYGEAAEKKLGIGPDHPRTRAFRLITGGAPDAHEMLARLGANWIPDAPPEAVRKFGLINETSSYYTKFPPGLEGNDPAVIERRARHTRHKIGDEIRTYYNAAWTNGSYVRRKAFAAFLEQEAAAAGLDKVAFLGVSDYGKLEAADALPFNPGLYERRLYYATQRFGHLASVPGRVKEIKALTKTYPNVHVYNNYSPHPVPPSVRELLRRIGLVRRQEARLSGRILRRRKLRRRGAEDLRLCRPGPDLDPALQLGPPGLLGRRQQRLERNGGGLL